MHSAACLAEVECNSDKGSCEELSRVEVAELDGIEEDLVADARQEGLPSAAAPSQSPLGPFHAHTIPTPSP